MGGEQGGPRAREFGRRDSRATRFGLAMDKFIWREMNSAGVGQLCQGNGKRGRASERDLTGRWKWVIGGDWGNVG